MSLRGYFDVCVERRGECDGPRVRGVSLLFPTFQGLEFRI